MRVHTCSIAGFLWQGAASIECRTNDDILHAVTLCECICICLCRILCACRYGPQVDLVDVVFLWACLLNP